MKTIAGFAWMFECPIHGWEKQVLCFRAFDEKLLSNWHYFKVDYQEVESTEEERQKMIDELRNQA